MTDSIDIHENFFSATSKLWHGDLSLNSLGESGKLISHTMQNDDYVIIALLLAVILSLIMGKLSLPFTIYKLSNISRPPFEKSFTLQKTVKKAPYLNYFILQGIVLGAFLTLSYSMDNGLLKLSISVDKYIAMGLFTLAFLVYIIIRTVASRVVNATFYTRSQRRLCNIERHFFLALSSSLLLPITIAYLFLGCSAPTCLKLAIAGIIITKAFYFNKVNCIFFRKNGSFLRFFLYLCTLEAVPIALLIGILALIISTLSTNI